MSRLGAVIAISLLASPIVPAAAQGFKPMPDRDVAITYRVTRLGEPPITERVRWQAADRRARIELPHHGVSLVDLAAGTVTILTPRTRTYATTSGLPADFATLLAAKAPRQIGGDTVAGSACTRWTWHDGDTGNDMGACVTADGVMLERDMDGQAITKASSVRYGKQPPASFAIPDGYEANLSGEGGLP